MATSDAPTRGPARPAPYITAGVLIAVAIVMPLCVPIYARMDPTLGGIPFFYWYQMLWVIGDAILVTIAYFVVKKEDDRRRAAVRGNAADSNGGVGR
ncbi:DUF3311 domain-containing protein [Spelaeicoccus albus]|uniref:DUF3311 domain-containing protein n=1 Tax=Spelaeicoccus albus TaxID=1280376 RepID=A0A7Z0D146_9MICO|nr:DUF3311 domain-containing protein [Spelaeicoccus albus]NYI66323.1 hypothetical protein [Spelaeicoccus albus]